MERLEPIAEFLARARSLLRVPTAVAVWATSPVSEAASLLDDAAAMLRALPIPEVVPTIDRGVIEARLAYLTWDIARLAVVDLEGDGPRLDEAVHDLHHVRAILHEGPLEVQ